MNQINTTTVTSKQKAIIFSLMTGALCVANLGALAGVFLGHAAYQWFKVYQGR